MMIRTATQTDIPDIMQIWLATNIRTHSFVPEEYWRSHFDDVQEAMQDSTIYIYQIKDQIVGFIGLLDNYIAGIFVNANFQNSGIGTDLLQHAQRSHTNLVLDVYVKNTSAISFYQKSGFTIAQKDIDTDTDEEEYRMSWQK